MPNKVGLRGVSMGAKGEVDVVPLIVFLKCVVKNSSCKTYERVLI